MPSHINFNYYSTEDFCSDPDIQNICRYDLISALHLNVRSLAANKDKLLIILNELRYSFSLTALSETKIKQDKECLVNIDIEGYQFLSQPVSNAVGSGTICER